MTNVAVMTANALCRISGLSINANFIGGAYDPSTTFLDAVNVAGKGVVVDEHAIIEQGYYNVLCPNGSFSGPQHGALAAIGGASAGRMPA